MVEIRYGEQYEVADLGGDTVAKAREQYKSEFGIPDKTEARVNGKGIGKRHESRMQLGANDRVTFGKKSMKGLMLVGALLIAMVVTGGAFAYTATSDVVTPVLTEGDEFASVTPLVPNPWKVFKNYKGTMKAGDLFTVAPATDFTGDLSVIINLANGDVVVDAYRVLVMEIQIMDSDAVTPLVVDGPYYLTLSNGECNFSIDQSGFTAPYTVELVSGFYVSNRAHAVGAQKPTLLCDVVQKGAMAP